MKKFKLFSLLIIGLTALCICCGRSKTENVDNEMGENLSAADTTLAIKKANEVMDLLKHNDIAKALDKIYVIDSVGNPEKLSQESIEELTQRFEMFPVKKYKLQRFYFKAWNNNLIDYMTEFYESDNPGAPNKIAVVFNPVRKDGEWYLTLKNTRQ